MLDISCKMNLNNDMKKLPTYEEYIKDMPLVDQIKFYYDVDIDNYLGDPWEILAECAVDPHWLSEFKVNFKEYLQEREYIQ
jgi:hypothetical protein